MNDIDKLITLMESLDSLTSEDASSALRNLMQNGQGIGRLVEYYCRNQSIRALELLCIVQEPHEKILLDKIKEAIASKKAVLSTIILLGQIIQKEPSWLPKLPNHSVFSAFLLHINDCKDPNEIIAGLLLLASLLPFCSRMNVNSLYDLFKTFLNNLCFLRQLRQRIQKRPAQDHMDREIDKIHLSHLQYSVVQFFIILYGIFPCNLIAFIRKVARRGSEEQRKAVEMHIGPLFSLVRLHPSLAFMSSKKETANERWIQREPHDFFADSRRLTIGFAGIVDVTDGTVKVKEFDTCSQSSSTSGSTITNMNYGIILPADFQANNDDWSPNELDLDTPSDDRSLSPIHFHGRSQSTIIPRSGNQISQRRPSIGQRVTSFFRSLKHKKHSQSQDSAMSEDGFSSRSSAATLRRHLSNGPSMDNTLPEIDDEEEDDDAQTIPANIEIVSAHSEELYGDYLTSSLEEGVDAAAAECSPVVERRSQSQSRTPKASTEEDPGLAAAQDWRSRSSSFLFGLGRGNASSNHSSIHDTPTETADHSAAALFLATPRQSRANTDDEEMLDDDGVDEHCHLGSFSLPKESGRTETEVHRMLFRINRKRFCSECPQSTISPDALLLRETLKHNNVIREEDLLSNGTSNASHPHVLKRSRSLPILSSRQRRRVRIQPEAQVIAGRESDDESTPGLEAEENRTLHGFDYLSQQKLIGLLPYLPLIRNNNSDVGIEDLVVEFELYRQRYLDASARHHNCLRELGLADRAPGRIYDDMSRLLEGMPSEKQCELLKTRLILVNQHLMYERCGRLMHGVRNRRLFGRLKQQKALESEILTLKKSRHSSYEHNFALVKMLSDLRLETNSARKMEKEKYQSLEKLYGEALKRRSALEEKVVHLEKQRNIDSEIIEQLREDLDASRRCHNDTEARLIFAKRQLQDFERMKLELMHSQKQLQKLRDGMAISQHESNRQSTLSLQNANSEAKQAENDELLNAAENEIRQIKEENRRLKIECERAKQQAAVSDVRARDEAIKANDMKIEFERKCRIHRDQYDAAQHKFSTLMTVLAKQEAYIAVLYNEIEKLSDKPYVIQDPVDIPHREVPSETGSYDGSFCGSNSGNGFQNDLFTHGDGIRREFSAQDFESRFKTKTNTL